MARRRLDVYLNADLTGTLEQDDSGSLSFRYAADWLAAANAVPLSTALPLRAELFKRNACRPFFAGLLPEEGNRRLIARTLGVSDQNDFAILEKIGGECAGAVSLMPPGEKPGASASQYKPLTLEDLAARMAELPKKPLLAGETGIRLSLAGAQNKLALTVTDGRYLMPLNGAPSTHILKPQSPHFDHLVENECLCMQLAAKVGLETAHVEISSAGGLRLLQIERYDRRRLPDGTLERIHQEDFCQALGIPPELKYQQEGGPGLRRCFELVRAVSAVPAVDVLRLFDAVVFNVLIGNGDAHGKNFSFLHAADGTRLAPLYDLVCTQAYPHLDQRMAMKIGTQRDPAAVRPKDWQQFFQDAGVGTAPAVRRMRTLAARVQEAAEGWSATEPGQETVLQVIRHNCVHLLSFPWKAE